MGQYNHLKNMFREILRGIVAKTIMPFVNVQPCGQVLIQKHRMNLRRPFNGPDHKT